MSESHRKAARISAQIRRKNRLVRELANTPPLTADQRAEVITAAAEIPVDEHPGGTR